MRAVEDEAVVAARSHWLMWIITSSLLRGTLWKWVFVIHLYYIHGRQWGLRGDVCGDKNVQWLFQGGGNGSEINAHLPHAWAALKKTCFTNSDFLWTELLPIWSIMLQAAGSLPPQNSSLLLFNCLGYQSGILCRVLAWRDRKVKNLTVIIKKYILLSVFLWKYCF